MAEELEKVNTDLAQALKGLQEVRRIRIQVEYIHILNRTPAAVSTHWPGN